MALWMIRAGRDDIFYPIAIEYGLAILGFHPVPDLSAIKNKDDLRAIIKASYPAKPNGTITRWTNEIAAFLWEIERDDTIIMPYNKGWRFRIGSWGGEPYQYRPEFGTDGRHMRPVSWIGDIGRKDLDDGIWEKLQDRCTVKALDCDLTLFPPRNSGAAVTSVSESLEFDEGIRSQVERNILSRNKAIVDKAWNANIVKNNGLGKCEACSFEHRSRNMFDVHHLNPIAVGGARPCGRI